MEREDIHVVPRENGWAILKEGNDIASQIYKTQDLAIERAKVEAKDCQSEVVIHGEDGKIRQKNSYGNDPVSSNG